MYLHACVKKGFKPQKEIVIIDNINNASEFIRLINIYLIARQHVQC